MKTFLIVFFLFTSSLAFAQLEKLGVYGGYFGTISAYNSTNARKGQSDLFLSQGFRGGVMTSNYLDERFSFESGLFLDYFKLNDRKQISLKSNLGDYTLSDHEMINFGVPIGLRMRTNLTPSCVTYLKASINTIFTVYETQTTSQLDKESSFNNKHTITKYTPRFYSTDLDLGFGTFWYIRSLGMQLCLEPKVTLARFRRGQSSFVNQDIPLYDHTMQFFARFGFEVTIYKDMFE